MTSLELDIVELASAADAAWFAARPNRTTRIRRFIAGEGPPMHQMGDGVACVAVRQIVPGVRARFPVYLPCLPPDTEAAAAAVLERARVTP